MPSSGTYLLVHFLNKVWKSAAVPPHSVLMDAYKKARVQLEFARSNLSEKPPSVMAQLQTELRQVFEELSLG